jgi:hypothetical protein
MKNEINKSVIERLQNLSPEERPVLIQEIYEKNRKFFKKNISVIDRFLENTKCEYRIDITEKFLNIVHVPSGQLGHPEAGLDAFAMMMGDWVHNAWVDLFNIRSVSPPEQFIIHNTPFWRMLDFTKRNFPAYPHNFASGKINLKVLEDGRRFSPPVIFLGIFHGLHIDYFFSRTDVHTALFMEPDIARFEVSCYFLDYEAIREKIGGRLYIALGEDERAGAIQEFFTKSRIAPLIWARALPAYAIPQAPVMIENLKLLQTARTDMIFPLDFELQGLINGFSQIEKKRFLLSGEITTSSQCRIAVVATGPSLSNDLEWLKDNQKNVIIFAVHSSVKILKKHGIIPDFQFCLDIHPSSPEELAALDLYKEKPMIQYYKATDGYFNVVDTVLMVAEEYKPDPVILKKTLAFTHPSTTCLAFAFADYCSPQEIYLIGCDFGYRSVENDHAAGSMYEELQNQQDTAVKTHYGTTLQAIVPSNFKETGFIQTTTFLSIAKITIESRIETSKKHYKVFNMSDGVEVKHAIPKRNSDVLLQRYSKKKKDVNKIMRAFKRAERNENWLPFPEKGSDIFLAMKKRIIDRLSLEQFSWMSAARAFDGILDELINLCREKKDLRMAIYENVIANILGAMYSCLLFHDSEDEAEKVYKSMIMELERIFDEDLYWPKELDEIV